MNDELLTMVERDVLSWPGVTKETGRGGGPGQGGFWVLPATVYRFGRRQIGHIHDTGVADLTFPRGIYNELVSDERAKPHGAGFAGVVSYHIREPEDVIQGRGTISHELRPGEDRRRAKTKSMIVVTKAAGGRKTITKTT
jgi:hypothetical protein